jgi:predicted DNA-binding transcriptional regulator YafY
MFEVSPRTIYRDIDTINMAGIPVLSASGVGGGFESAGTVLQKSDG